MIPYEELVQALSAWRRRKGLPVGPFMVMETANPAAAKWSQGTAPRAPTPVAAPPVDDGEILVSADFAAIADDYDDQTAINTVAPDEYFSAANDKSRDHR